MLSAIKLKESKSPSSDRIVAVFKVFDDVIPHTGVFSKVLEIIRDEVYDAVFSERYTSSQEVETSYKTATNVVVDRGEETKTYIERIPYFSLVQTVFAQRNEEVEELKEELIRFERQLKDKEKQNMDAQSIITSQSQQILKLSKTVENKSQVIEGKDDEIESLKETSSDFEKKTTNDKRRLENIIRKLEENLSEEEKEVNFLNQYKKGYDDLHQAFIFSPEEDKFPGMHSKKKKAVLSTKKNHLLSSYEAAKKIEQQLLKVQNQIIEEFDSYLETHKAELSSKHFTDKETTNFSEDHQELNRIDLELQEVQDRFKTTIGSLANELDMIRQQKNSLEKELEELMKVQAPKPPSFEVKSGFRSISKESSQNSFPNRKQSTLSGKGSSVSAEPVESFDLLSSQQDPFVPQETILSKYSVMIYTSANSKQTFHELKDGKFCSSCGEKTVLCPHKVSDEMIITLPHNCTHIKLARPKIRLPVEVKQKLKTKLESVTSTKVESETKPAYTILSRQSMTNLAVSTHFFHEDSITPGKVDTAAIGTVSVENPVDGKPAILGGMQEQQGNWLTVNSFMKLWDDYKTRTSLLREIPRPMKLDHTLSIVAQYYADVLWHDENSDEQSEKVSIIEGLYDFMFDRYLTNDVTFLVMHDFISSLIDNAVVNKHVQIFSHILVGNLDGAVFRYLLLIADLIDRVDWRYVEDFKGFIANIYPFLNEDDIDQLHLAYTSFSENKIRKDLVYEFFLYIVLKYREPQFHEIESKLLQHPAKETGVLNQQEFFDAMEVLSPLSSEKLRNRLFEESALHYCEDNKVSVMRLSQIGSYLLLLQVAPLLRSKVAENVEDARLHHQIQATLSKADVEASRKSDIMSMTKLRNLARNVARREQHRSLRQIEGNLQFNTDEDSDSNTFLAELLLSSEQVNETE
ncbi:uncharacterized protein [Antedon mediterranea]|uniref:uncharacterized protein n=1 Tax=Antedon mediterranea TaxID=105859 RepID=UPI003AF611EB